MTQRTRLLRGAVCLIVALAVWGPRALADVAANVAPGSAAATSTPTTATNDPDAEGVVLPRPLSEADVTRYRRIFALGERGSWKAVDALIAELDDRVLVGHVMAQRYLHPNAYRSRFKELKGWLATYADHPDAPRIYALAMRRKPKSWAAPRRSVRPGNGMAVEGTTRRSPPAIPRRGLGKAERRKAARLKRLIRHDLRNGWTKDAKERVRSAEARKLLSRQELDEARARLGHGYLLDGRDAWAIEWSEKALARSAKYLPFAHWTTGLAAWRLGDYTKAARHFESLAKRRDVSAWYVSGAAFWAARSHLRARQPQQVNIWLTRAAAAPHTFYGLLARRMLGLPTALDWGEEERDLKALDLLAQTRAGRRALALLQIGQSRRAARELERMAGDDEELARGVLIATDRAELADVTVRLNSRLFPGGGGPAAAAYPLPGWAPHDGFRIDRALVYAVIRQDRGSTRGPVAAPAPAA